MAPQAPLRLRRILVAGGVGMGIGAAVVVMLHAVVVHTPVEVSARTFVLYFVMFCAFGAVAGLTLETVRQLQVRNPDPAYHRYPQPLARHTPDRPRPPGDPAEPD